MNQVESNITDYNPVLHGYVEEINQQIAQIDVLEARLGILKDRRDYVAHVIDWRINQHGHQECDGTNGRQGRQRRGKSLSAQQHPA